MLNHSPIEGPFGSFHILVLWLLTNTVAVKIWFWGFSFVCVWDHVFISIGQSTRMQMLDYLIDTGLIL